MIKLKTPQEVLQKYLASIIEHTDDIAVIKDLDLRVLAANPAFLRKLEVSSVEAVIGKTDAELFRTTSEQEQIKGFMDDERQAQSLPKGASLVKEEIVTYPSGESRIFLTRKFPIFDEGGLLFATANISSDITAERENEERLRMITSNSYDLISEHDTTGKFLFVNERLMDILGYSHTELEGKRFLDFVHPEDLPEAQSKMQEALLQQEIPVRTSLRIKRKDGAWLWVEISGKTYRNFKGETRIVSSLRDMTERKNFELRLEEINRTQDLILSYSPVGILYVKNSTIQWANPRFRELSGYYGEITDLNVSIFFPSETAYQLFLQRWYPVLEQGLTVDTEEFFRRIDGSLTWCSLKGKTLDPKSPKEGAIWLFEDITELKNARRIRRITDARVRALYVLSQALNKTEEEIISYAVEMALELTESKLGYLDFLKEGETGPESGIYAFSRTISMSMLSHGQSAHPIGKGGHWGRCIKTGKAEVNNAAQSPEDGWGSVSGHFPIDRYILLPLRENKDTVAVLGVANKADPYDENDVQQLDLFLGQVWQLIQKKRAQAAMKENGELFRAITQAATEAIIIFDGKGLVAVWNESAVKLLGFSADEAIGKSIFELLAAEEDPEALHRLYKERLGKQKSQETQTAHAFNLKDREGKIFPAELSIATFRKSKEWWGLIILRRRDERKPS